MCFFSSGEQWIKTSFSLQHGKGDYILISLSPYPKNVFIPNHAVSSKPLGKKERGTEVCACETTESYLIFTWHLWYCVVIFSVRSKMKRLPAKLRIVHGSVFGSVFRHVTKYLVYYFFHKLFIYVWCNTDRMAPETAREIKKEWKFQSQNREQTERGAELKVWVSEWIENGAQNIICETKGEACRRKPTSAIKCPSLHSYGHH